MFGEGLSYFYIGKYEGISIYPRQDPLKATGKNYHHFWISEYKVNERFMFMGCWYLVLENSLKISEIEGQDSYKFYAKRIS
jgi:hypothetical protein